MAVRAGHRVQAPRPRRACCYGGRDRTRITRRANPVKSAARTAKAARSRAAHARPKRRNSKDTGQRPRGTPRASGSIVLAALAMALIPLIIAPSTADPFRLPKTLLFQATGLLLLGAMVMRVLLRGGADRRTLLHDHVNQTLV